MEDDEFPFKDEEPRIRKIIQEQESAWNASSARRFCARIRMDASLTSIQGGVYDGREAIEARMSEVFAAFKGTRISMKIRNVRFEGAVAMVEIDTEVSALKTLPPGIRASGGRQVADASAGSDGQRGRYVERFGASRCRCENAIACL
jgi:uncharacterized protein (TIGR02246 family)